jgi:hypothetical protein
MAQLGPSKLRFLHLYNIRVNGRGGGVKWESNWATSGGGYRVERSSLTTITTMNISEYTQLNLQGTSNGKRR